MLNELIVMASFCVVAAFMLYLAWDAHQDNKAAHQDKKKNR